MGSERAQVVARWFGVEAVEAEGARRRREGGQKPHVPLRGGQIVLLSGASGAGKSTLLRSLYRKYHRATPWIDLAGVRLGGKVVIDLMAEAAGGGRTEADILGALDALSRVGLGEVWTYLKRPGQLSEGQRWRLRLALALARTNVTGDLCVLAADEFAAPLDRVTALVVARALRKAATARPNLCAVVATPRDDLLAALDPDIVVECDFGLFNLHERGAL
jgi:ABC-type ATPase with predicted acetyltransferase domain